MNEGRLRDDVEEPALVARAKAGDRSAFDRLVELHEKAVRGYVRARLSDADDAADVAQETWIDVWRHFSDFDSERGPVIAFAKNRASFLIKRSFTARKEHRDRQVNDAEVIFERLSETVSTEPEPELEAAAFGEALRATFNSSSPPHQLIVFGFVKTVGWTPRGVVTELSDLSLHELERHLEQAYMEQSDMPELQIAAAFAGVRVSMAQPFGTAITDPKTLDTYPQLAERVVGRTCLREYYTDADPAKNVSQWWWAVQRRVRSEILRGGSSPLHKLLARSREQAARNRPSIRKSGGGHTNV